VLFGVLNDEFVPGAVGLVPDHLPRSHSLRCVRASSIGAVLSVGTIFQKLIFRNVAWRQFLSM